MFKLGEKVICIDDDKYDMYNKIFTISSIIPYIFRGEQNHCLRFEETDKIYTTISRSYESSSYIKLSDSRKIKIEKLEKIKIS